MRRGLSAPGALCSMAEDTATGEAMNWDQTRPGELEVELPKRMDANLVFIGRIRTPFASRDQCPRQGKADGPVCRIEIDPLWQPALKGLEHYGRVEVIYWMHQARRDLLQQSPRSDRATTGTFALRSPVRPTRSPRRSARLSASRMGCARARAGLRRWHASS